MSHVIETCLIALIPGAFEGLLAVAIVFTYRVTGVINLALGGAGASGAFVAASLAPHVGVPASIALGLVCSALLTGVVTAAALPRNRSILDPVPVLVTAAPAVALEQILTRAWPVGLEFPNVLPQTVVGVWRFQVTELHLAGLVLGLVAVAGTALALRSATLGRWRFAWRRPGTPRGGLILLIPGVIAGASACLEAQVTFGPGYMLTPLLVALMAAIIARFRRVDIAFGVAVLVEMARNMSVRYDPAHAGYVEAMGVILVFAAALYLPRLLLGAPAAGRKLRLSEQHEH
jgi:branched-chain amino acid transport system permease protein